MIKNDSVLNTSENTSVLN